MSLRQVIGKQREAIAEHRRSEAKFEDRESKETFEEIAQRIRWKMNCGESIVCFELDGHKDERYRQIVEHFFRESDIPMRYSKNSKGKLLICVDTNNV